LGEPRSNPRITCLVGKDESGKIVVLDAREAWEGVECD
jgi:hypothetical protein